MKEVYFNPKGGAIVASARFTHSKVMIANYSMMLRLKDSNESTILKVGDNTNVEDDCAALSQPVSLNDGRRLILETGFVGQDFASYPQYDIVLELHQDGNILGYAHESGVLTGKGQYSLLFIKLIAS
ncbi:MAG TPA: hypothetical protein PL009_06065 [Flavipsychrobacter sp.]|nr:hypothetical protein [Flavipsychrobacter sp.]